VLSEGELTARSGAGAPGPLHVSVSDAGGASRGGPVFTYIVPKPVEEEHKEEEHKEEEHKEEEKQGERHEEEKTTTTSTTSQVKQPESGVLGSQTSSPPVPQFALTGNLDALAGHVRVKIGKGKWIDVTGIRQVPFGVLVDATEGRVAVTTVGNNGKQQTMTYYQGEFVLTQGHDGLVVATLAGGSRAGCPTRRRHAHGAVASRSRKKVVRKLWASGHGSYSTKGSYAAGAVLGTRWLTEDFCNGTLIRVATDRVAVTNLVNHHHVTVKAGHSYFAKAP
jgi:hypothetical protein